MSAVIKQTIEGDAIPANLEMVSCLPITTEVCGYLLSGNDMGPVLGLLKAAAEILAARKPDDYLPDRMLEIVADLEAITPKNYKVVTYP